ncbi:Replicase polyprotein 1a [Trachymyrmex zeteki]|uniref:Replicase polyprotein 1a n=2 Tax=Mycetomoellerius zeteki TaxID=64791 RepID=A0A151WYA9_9HYME|nr:PREDICTED: FK506-binding protein 4-like isoform X2 [Trachymyrmex zeteki]XP_018307144.1 PREDICTED: FK506-binding protein 4-like isoform X2 [Trachymyrmex zeteki]KYQ52747.1 Replicase polyprotein 1a [Trachymyrmex zeteki]
MRLSTIFELLLILLLVAFAAYGRVIDHNEATHRVARATNNVKQSDIDLSMMSLKQATDSVNRYCTCNENICNCCRDFHIPLIQLKGPGCASLQYLQGDNLAVQLSFGDNILTSTIVNGKNPKPVCVPLPGGFTKFCGRIYSIQRDAKNHFKACLGLELQSPTELEATLRVSCFRFGPDGLKLRPAESLPTIETDDASEEEDDDDFFGLGSDDDDDDEDDERPITNSVPDGSEVDAQESDDDDDDPLGFSALLDIFTGDDDVPTRPKVTTAAPLLEFTIPILPRPTTPVSLEDHELATNNEQETNYDEHDSTQEPFKAEEEEEEEEDTGLTESNTEDSTDENNEQITESSNKIVYTAKPDKAPIVNKVKKGNKKKPTVTSTSVNAIHDSEKPAKKPIKDEDDDDDDDILDDDDDDLDEDDSLEDDDDDDKDDEDDDEDEDEENDDKLDDNEKHEEHDDDDEGEKAEDFADLDDDDDDDEEEDAMLSALIDNGKKKKSKENTKSNQTNVEHDGYEDDYDLEFGFLGRKRHSSENRQSKITRL